MQTIYLIRHAIPDLPARYRLYLERTDIPPGMLDQLQDLCRENL